MTDERIVYLPETDSTNSEIRRRLVECPDMRGGTVVAADFQTAGRGQKGNSWESQSGKNLLFSILPILSTNSLIISIGSAFVYSLPTCFSFYR